MRDLLGRILIAVPLLVAVLAAAYFDGWWLFAVAVVAGVLALHELYSMLRPLRPLVLAGFAGVLTGFVGAELGGAEWLFAGLLATFVFAFGLYGIAETRQSGTVTIATTILGAFWIGAGVGHLILLRDIGGDDDYLGRLSIFTVLLAVWAGDTAAYFAGRLVGRHRLAAVLSPGKTWEGFVAGSAVSVLVAFFALYQDRDEFLAIWQALVLGAVIAVVGTIGDLFESAVKRDMGVKDSGRLLGGHGGVLDRIDALLFASVAGYYTIVALH
jgi:phosphatidate cytidylyltransferase